MLSPGDKFTHNGFTVIIHEIRNREVYYEKRQAAYSGSEYPQGNEANCQLHYRMDLEDFEHELCLAGLK